MKVALVHDYLSEFGGAERVLLALCEIFPKAPIYTAFVKKDSPAYRRFKDKKIITSWAQNVPFFASKLHSPLRFLAPYIWGSFDFSGYDVVITSASWFVTKGIAKQGKGPDLLSSRRPSQGLVSVKPIEICYCHTPPRYLYGYTTAADIKRNFLTKTYALVVNHFMRVYDFEAAQRVDYFIANSREVQSRIKKFYRRDSRVIYPPVDIKRFTIARGPVASFPPVSARSSQKSIVNQKDSVELHAVGSLSTGTTPRNNYFLVVSRLVASKNVDLVVEVCAKLGLPLKVVGTGREMKRLKKLASTYSSSDPERSEGESRSSRPFEFQGKQARTIGGLIEFLGDVSDDELISLYQNCRAVIFAASQEDFGLVPVEAASAGKPVIVNAQGGVLESVIDAIGAGKGKGTGVYFDPPTAGSLTLAINNFMDLEKKGYFNAKFIRAHAQKFSKERFKREILKFVGSKVK